MVFLCAVADPTALNDQRKLLVFQMWNLANMVKNYFQNMQHFAMLQNYTF